MTLHTSNGRPFLFAGVYWVKNASKWRAQGCINGVNTYFGQYHDEKQAALAYDKEMRQVYGVSAEKFTNFLPSGK